MSPHQRRLSPIYRQLEAYREFWKKDHAAAMICRDWEDALAVGINILHMLKEREQAWRDQVFRGVIPFDREDDLDHQERFAAWLDTIRPVLVDVLPVLERRFGSVEGAEQLRQCAEEANRMIAGWQPPTFPWRLACVTWSFPRRPPASWIS